MKALDRIKRAIASRKGNVIMRSDLARFGTPATITRCIKILCDEMKLAKISHGMYVKAKKCTIDCPPLFSGTFAEPVATTALIFAEALDRLGVVYELSYAQRNYMGGMRQVPCRTSFEVFDSKIKRKIYVGKNILRYERDFKRPEDIVWYEFIPDDDDIYGETRAYPLDKVPSYSIIERKRNGTQCKTN